MVFGFLLFASVLAFAGYWAADMFLLKPEIPTTTSPKIRSTTISEFTFDDCGYTGTEPAHLVDLMSNTRHYFKDFYYNGHVIGEEPEMGDLYEVMKRGVQRNYSLFTRSNKDLQQDLVMNDLDSIINSNFDANSDIIVIIHDFTVHESLEDQKTKFIEDIKEASLVADDVNVIVVEWLEYEPKFYVNFLSVPTYGRDLGNFLRFLHKSTGVHYTRMHLVGFGFGAHLAGNAGRILNGKVARITALDPAGTAWNKNNYRIKNSDAVYVEAIHTDGDYTVDWNHGIGARVGHVDFYPNGGLMQPGCEDFNVPTLPVEHARRFCCHNFAWKLFAASIRYNVFDGYKCANSKQVQIDFCRGSVLRMGNNLLNKSGTGMYRLNTGSEYPFYLE